MLSSSFMDYSDSAQKKSNDTRHDLHSALLRTCVVRALATAVHVSDELRAKRRRGSHGSMCVASAWLWQTLKGLARSYFSKSQAGAVLDSDSNILGRRTHAAPTHYNCIEYLYIGVLPSAVAISSCFRRSLNDVEGQRTRTRCCDGDRRHRRADLNNR